MLNLGCLQWCLIYDAYEYDACTPIEPEMWEE